MSVPDNIGLDVEDLLELKREREKHYQAKDSSGLSLADILAECEKSRKEHKVKPVNPKKRSSNVKLQKVIKQGYKIINCGVCGVEIEKDARSRTMYCTECAKKRAAERVLRFSAKKYAERHVDHKELYEGVTCIVCGFKFDRKWIRQQFCSNACSKFAQYHRKHSNGQVRRKLISEDYLKLINKDS